MGTAVKSEHRKVLVLNRNWTPVGTVSLQRALTMIFSEYEATEKRKAEPKAKIIHHETFETFEWETWSKLKVEASDDFLAGVNVQFRVPEIILLSRYEKLPKPKVHFSRRTLYKRDQMTCQYCGRKPGSEELTIDHVKPRSQGGDTSWENCVLACIECNSFKANRTPEQAKMKLNCVPAKPRYDLFRFDTLKPLKSWTNFISEAFWNVELKNDMPK